MIATMSALRRRPIQSMSNMLLVLCCLLATNGVANGFAVYPTSKQHSTAAFSTSLRSEPPVSPPASPSSSIERNPDVDGTDEWELDCYSRPVLVGGKKLWEVLITDSSGSFRVCETLPSNKVNSKELRRVVEEAIEKAEVKPSIIRFFRGAMFNMINIALSDVDAVAKPSRCTFSLAGWIEERNRNVYPNMEGYRKNMAAGGPRASFLDVRTPVKLPDALRGEKYAFVSLPLAEFREGGGVTKDNFGVGKLCPVDLELPADAFVQGVVVITSRAKSLASWLAGTELAGFKCDLRKRTLVMETDIDNQYLMAKLNDVQRAEGMAFEEGKDMLGGLHFLSVQCDDDSDPDGFWLLKEVPDGLL